MSIAMSRFKGVYYDDNGRYQERVFLLCKDEDHEYIPYCGGCFKRPNIYTNIFENHDESKIKLFFNKEVYDETTKTA